MWNSVCKFPFYPPKDFYFRRKFQLCVTFNGLESSPFFYNQSRNKYISKKSDAIHPTTKVIGFLAEDLNSVKASHNLTSFDFGVAHKLIIKQGILSCLI